MRFGKGRTGGALDLVVVSMRRAAIAGLTAVALVGVAVTVAAPPAAAAGPYRFDVHEDIVQDGSLWVYFRITGNGTGGAVEHRWVDANNNYSSWYSLGNPPGVQLIGTPSAVRSSDGRLTVFAVSAVSRHLWHKWQLCDGCGWSGWSDLGGGLNSNPDSVYKADLNVFVAFAVAHDGDVWHIWQLCPGCGWSIWTSLGGGPFTSYPYAGVDTFTGGAYVSAYHEDGRLRQRIQKSSSGDWGPWS